jgi:hypothetical protein
MAIRREFLLFVCAASVIEAKILVPGLTSNEYVIQGDINLAVLHRIPALTPDGLCSLEGSSLVYLLLQMCEAAHFAAKRINDASDLLPNITLGLVCVDSCGDAQVGLARALYLVEDSQCTNTSDETSLTNHKVVGVVGAGYSRVAAAVSNFFALFNIPVLSTFASQDDLSKHEYFLRMCPPEKFQARVFVDIIERFNWTYVGLFYSEGNYGEGGAKYIQQLLENRPICLAFSHLLTKDGKDNEVEEVELLLKEHTMVSVSIWFMEGPVMSRLLDGLQEADIQLNHIMLISDSTTDFANFPEYFQGGISIGFQLYEVPGFRDYLFNLIPGVNTKNPWLLKAFQEHFCKESNCSVGTILKATDVSDKLRYAMPYYEAVYVYANALHTLIASNCPEAFQDPDLFDEDCISGEELLFAMKETELNLVSGHLSFDNNGDRNARYHLYYLQPTDNGESIQAELISVWDNHTFIGFKESLLNWTHLQEAGKEGNLVAFERADALFIPLSRCSAECSPKEYVIQKSPRCCWECRSCRDNERLADNHTTCEACPLLYWPAKETLETCEALPLDFLRWTEKLSLFLFVSSSLGFAVSSIFLVILIQHRNTRLVKASNKKLTFTMMTGTLAAFLMFLPIVAEPSTLSCFLRDVGFNVVFTILYAPLLVKTFTIFCIFKAGKKGRRTPGFVSNKGQTTILIVALLSQVNKTNALEWITGRRSLFSCASWWS